MFDVEHRVIEENTGHFNSYACISNDLFEAYKMVFEDIEEDYKAASVDWLRASWRADERKRKGAVEWIALPYAQRIEDDWLVQAKLRFVNA